MSVKTIEVPGVGAVVLYETEFHGHQGSGVVRTRRDAIKHVDGTPLSPEEEELVIQHLKSHR